MRTSFIRSLIQMVEESDIDSLEVSSWGRKVRVVKKSTAENGHGGTVGVLQPAPVMAQAAPVAPAPAPAAQPTPPPAAPAAEDTSKFVEIKSPMVGTYYSAAAPDAEPYVSSNQKINVGQVVCIVEAMKLMNEIEAEVSGRIAKILIENAQPVEFGQVMFLIEPD